MNRLARFAGFWGDKRGRGDHDDATPDEPRHQDAPVERMDPEELRDPIVEVLRTVHDPEIPVNIYDLGLIYRIDISARGEVSIDMTLTAPACPVAGTLPGLVEDAVRQVEGVADARVELVWDPPWSQEKMTEEARLELGMM